MMTYPVGFVHFFQIFLVYNVKRKLNSFKEKEEDMDLQDFTLSGSLPSMTPSLILLTKDIYDITPSTSASFSPTKMFGLPPKTHQNAPLMIVLHVQHKNVE